MARTYKGRNVFSISNIIYSINEKIFSLREKSIRNRQTEEKAFDRRKTNWSKI